MAYHVVAQHPHDVRHFTEGLEISDGKLFESVGGYGKSAIFIKDLRGGKIEKATEMPPAVFGEGLTLIGNLLFVLTWREGLGLVFDRGLTLQGKFGLSREGWGMTHVPGPDGERLVMSDGGSSLFEFDPRSMTQTGVIPVTDSAVPLEQLNELEFARGDIYSNVWHSDRVAVIQPGNGRVRAWVDLSGLKARFRKPASWDANEHVLNGIAFDRSSGHFFVTGKCWPVLFELQIDAVPDGARASE